MTAPTTSLFPISSVLVRSRRGSSRSTSSIPLSSACRDVGADGESSGSLSGRHMDGVDAERLFEKSGNEHFDQCRTPSGGRIDYSKSPEINNAHFHMATFSCCHGDFSNSLSGSLSKTRPASEDKRPPAKSRSTALSPTGAS